MRTVLFDIDTQRDFMEPGAPLYVPGAEAIVPAVHRLLEAARRHGVPVVASLDAHAPDDPEFARFPPHCVRGTRGQEKIPETAHGPFRRVPNVPVALGPLESGRALHLEKQGFSLLDNVNFPALYAALEPERCLVVGVATEFCVRAAALGLRGRGAEVLVVRDAVRAVDSAAGDRALAEFAAAGVRLVESSQALRLLAGEEG